MGDAAWCRLCLGREPPFSPVEGKWLDLITFTLGNLALSINPDLRLPSPLLCKVCEESMVEFKKFKTMVQRNIQFIIDNKDAIQTHGLPFLQLNKEGETEARNAPTEPLEEVDELLEKPDCEELNKIFDKDNTQEVKEEATCSEGEDYEDYYEEDEELETETKAKKRTPSLKVRTMKTITRRTKSLRLRPKQRRGEGTRPTLAIALPVRDNMPT